jgi:hypothetical protein
MGSLVHYAYWEKEMLGWIREKMATQESAPKGGKFFAFSSTAIRNSALACSDTCAPSGDCSTAIGNGYWDNTHTSDLSNRGERLGGEPSTLVQSAQRTSGSLDG